MPELDKICSKVLKNKKISIKEAGKLIKADIYELLHYANKIRAHFKGNKVKLCSVVNAKSGLCSENCKFCAQSAFSKSGVKTYPLIETKELKDAFKKAVSSKAGCFGVVTSGYGLSSKEVDRLCGFYSKNKAKNVKLSASLGILSRSDLVKLKASGVSRFHHNLETAESFFKNICTTHDYKVRLQTVKNAKKEGLEVCSGGIFGLGESFNQRLELAFTLRELDVDSVPLNFLNPIKGTPFENIKRIEPLEALRTIALFRFVLPDKDISVCGGREVNIKDLQSYIFYAGANGMMIGGYLTTQGRPVEQDLRMIKDLGLEVYQK
jgi:biotin synthase